MDKIAIYGKTPESKEQLKKEITKHGFIYEENRPDIVITYGGDGTFLWAERKYPGIPKALFRYSKTCKKCHNLPITHALELLKKKKYKIKTFNKIQAEACKTKMQAANDIVIRNILPTHAARFTIKVNSKKINEEFVGDGIVAATPFGSTAYFHSITRKTFKKGIGIAFNNTTKPHQPLFLPETAKIEIKITRGEAGMVADNEPRMIILKPGNKIKIKATKKKAKIISF
ncbi:NAD(+)/NADH kinase [Candidatus Woesearchaeota archaeon]|nr:NAD(+)/NADH kinase [Candidatus Woesearchaeota archaeon]MBW3016313.1 NAD(+)/NADH kinase [Candidatus Woesearchaeota archaeon]